MINPAEMCSQSHSLADFSPKNPNHWKMPQKCPKNPQLPIVHPERQLFSIATFEVQPEKPRDQHRPMAARASPRWSLVVLGRGSQGRTSPGDAGRSPASRLRGKVKDQRTFAAKFIHKFQNPNRITLFFYKSQAKK